MSLEPRNPMHDSSPEGGEDQAQLDRLASELQRELTAASPLSADFAQRLQASLVARPWSLRSALRQSPFLRAAAAFLVMSSVAAPVSAIMFLLQPEPEEEVQLEFLLPVELAEVVEAAPRPDQPTVPPLDASLEDAFGLDWHAAVARSNRMALVIAQWTDAQPASSSDVSVVPRTPQFQDWSTAEVADLKSEFERRARLGLTHSAPSSLEQRLRQLTDGRPEAELPAELAAWRWVLFGEGPPPMRVFFPSTR